MERKHYFILQSLVSKYGKDNVNTVNKIVTNNVKKEACHENQIFRRN